MHIAVDFTTEIQLDEEVAIAVNPAVMIRNAL
jgi:hypothetical protein